MGRDGGKPPAKGGLVTGAPIALRETDFTHAAGSGKGFALSHNCLPLSVVPCISQTPWEAMSRRLLLSR